MIRRAGLGPGLEESLFTQNQRRKSVRERESAKVMVISLSLWKMSRTREGERKGRRRE